MNRKKKRLFGRRTLALIMAYVMALSTIICFEKTMLRTYAAEPGVSYCSYIQGLTWLDWKKNGVMSGTTGKARKMEALKIKLVNKSGTGSITYRTYTGGEGWGEWVKDGAISGEVNDAKQIEAVQIKLTKAMAEKYDVYYRVHVQSKGWLSWTLNGKTAGTTGMSRRLEAIQIRLVKKGGSAPGETSQPYMEYSDTMYTDTLAAVGDLLNDVGFYNVGEYIERKAYYTLYDINGDGKNELFISTMHFDHETDYVVYNSFKLYTIVNNKVKEVKLPEKGRSRYDFILTSENLIGITFAPNHPYETDPDYYFYSLSADGTLVQRRAYEQVWGGYYGVSTDYYAITHGKQTLRLAGLYGKLFMNGAVEQALEYEITDIDKEQM